MTSQQRQEIIDYLRGPREHQAGAALYSQHGSNLRLKRLFAADRSASAHAIMIGELQKLAGLTDAEFRSLRRMANGTASAPASPQPARQPAPPVVEKMTRFRDKYKFLDSPDCPNVMKILVADMFTAYGAFKEAHARLRELPDDAEASVAAEDCRAVVEQYLENKAIREELDHYRDTGEILGKSAYFKDRNRADELASLTDVEVTDKLRSAQVQTAKRKKMLEQAQKEGDEDAISKARAAYETWVARKVALQTEKENRKKK